MKKPQVEESGRVLVESIEQLSRDDLRNWVRERLQGSDSVGPSDPRWGELRHHLLAVLYRQLNRFVREDLQSILLEFLKDFRDNPVGLWDTISGAELLFLIDPVLTESSRRHEAIDVLLDLADRLRPEGGDKPGLHYRVLQALLTLRHRASIEFWVQQADRPSQNYVAVLLDGLSLIDIAAPFRWLMSRNWSKANETALIGLLPGLLEDFGVARVTPFLVDLLHRIPGQQRLPLIQFCKHERLTVSVSSQLGSSSRHRTTSLERTSGARPFRRAKDVPRDRRRLLRAVKRALLQAGMFTFRTDRARKREFRKLFIIRLSAAAEMRGLRYSRLIHGLKLAGIGLDRQMLSEVAVHDPAAFDLIVALVREKLAQHDAARILTRRPSTA